MAFNRFYSVQVCLFLAATFTLVYCELKLLLLHTNDMHSRFTETNAYSGHCRSKCYGGFPRLKSAADRYKKEAQEKGWSTIFLNAGDTFQGTIYYTLFKWKIASELINLLGIDVMSLGNHEFDDGPKGLAPYIDHSTVPIVCANIDYSKEPIFTSDPNITRLSRSHILRVKGVKIGVIGYLTPDTQFLSQTGKVTLKDEVTSIKEEAARLKDQGVKILIALGHAGIAVDKKIAAEVPDIDVVVGGHTNSFLYNGKPPDIEKAEGDYPTIVTQSSGRKVPVVQAYAYTKYLGYLKLTFNDEGEVTESEGNPVLLDHTFPKDEEIEKALAEYKSQVKELEEKEIGLSSTFLEGDVFCRIQECNLANLAADAMMVANAINHTGKGWTDAPIALVGGGGIRTSIDTQFNGGRISYADMMMAMPFKNPVIRMVVSGKVLLQVLEHSVSRFSLEHRHGEFMQYSGVQVVYDLAKPSGSRVESAKVRCGECWMPQYFPLSESCTYTVLVTAFLAQGGDGYDMLKSITDKKTLPITDFGAVLTYLNHTSPVYPEVSGRIVLKNLEALNSGIKQNQSAIMLLICLLCFRVYG